MRLVSDLHIDINKDSNFGFRYNTDILLIAGDIAGSYEKELKFLNSISKQINEIYVVAGNHLGYDNKSSLYFRFLGHPNLITTKQQMILDLVKNTPDNVYYLENTYVDLGNYILFGGTMYSNYELNGEKSKNILAGLSYLNDFRYVYVNSKMGPKLVEPSDYIQYFKNFKKALNKCYKETTKDIIVLTHFAPSKKSISEKYNNDMYLNASYTTELDDYIIKHPRIKYWLHGHMHDQFDYFINQCHVMCYPYGYANYEHKLKPKKYFGIEFNP